MNWTTRTFPSPPPPPPHFSHETLLCHFLTNIILCSIKSYLFLWISMDWWKVPPPHSMTKWIVPAISKFSWDLFKWPKKLGFFCTLNPKHYTHLIGMASVYQIFENPFIITSLLPYYLYIIKYANKFISFRMQHYCATKLMPELLCIANF